ncbi:glucose-1-phosphate adenylyltransferase [Candidatus Thiosymbion oneisti]|uniref:glucose-1-phosphate adenylyltransferase n=1 Tax=Candidatus Thiosymbion oneisti TaxID=589554 RepID=UPI000A55DDAE|nr:glucose-1-phosphate adenylyltransferase [Candidatus Thiosymbion oneisti]
MPDGPRFVSYLTRNTLALILAGGRGSRLKQLTKWRSKPAVPFGGKFRIVDFPLSNCVNSGIRRIGVLTQYKAHSLILHIQKGWGSLHGEFGEFVELWPAQQRIAAADWYAGTADAVYQNLDIIRNHNPEYVLVLAGDHVYKMDYGAMVAQHVRVDADMTVGCIEVELEQAEQFGIMAVDTENRICSFREKPAHPEPIPERPNYALASMGIYVFNSGFLFEQLIRDADQPDSTHDFGKDIIPDVITKYRVMAYPFRDVPSGDQGYWRDVGTVDAFWEANQELIGVTPPLNLYDESWPIWTYQEQLPPAKFVFDDEERRGMAVDSMVSSGCVISGAKVRHSLLFSNVRVNSYSYVKDAVILPGVDVGRNCEIHRSIIDRGCRLPGGLTLGLDPQADAERGFYVSEGGVTLVTPEMLGQEVHHVR